MYRPLIPLLILVAGVGAQTDIRMRPPVDAASADKENKRNKKAGGPTPLEFDLEFHHGLSNRTKRDLENIRIYVPVPEDCYQQKVTNLVWLRGGEPTKKISIKKDQYGQRVVSFLWRQLSPAGELVVGYRCRAVLKKPPKTEFPLEDEKIPADLQTIYTKDASIYGLTSSSIRKKARELVDGRANMVERVRAIYDFVAQGVTYQRKGGWDPAPDVLERKSGSCSEFSYLFSSLCRANGIPTRFVGATMFRPKRVKTFPYVDKIWHRWVQVYFPGVGWVHMDPTRDRGKRAKHNFFGRQPGPSLVLSHHGGGSRFLGNHYVSADNQSSKRVKRTRRFSWMPVVAEQADK